MPSNHLLPLIQEVVQTFSLHYQEAIQPVLNQHGFRGGDWLRVFFAYGLEPQPLTMDLIQTLLPFGTVDRNRHTLVAASERGLLEQLDAHSFRLSETGRQGITAFFQATGQAIANLAPLSAAKMNRLAELLLRVIISTETAAHPTAKTRFLMSRRSDPGASAAAPVRIDQYLTDLTNYRDDAERDSWMSLNISGPAWELLGYLAENGGQTAVTISQQFSERRGYNTDEYAAVLNNLAEQGWLLLAADTYTITAKGQAVRDEAAQTADHIFYLGWHSLSADEQAELESLLQQLHDHLRQAGMKNIWQLANGALSAAAPLYTDKTRPVMAEVGFNKPGYFFVAWQGLGLEPHPISTANLARRAPYVAAHINEARFQNMLADGFLAAGENGAEYTLTQAAREAYTAVDTTFTTELSQIEMLSENGLNQLVTLIGGIADRSTAQEDETDKWGITTMRRMHRGEDAAPQVKLDEYLDDLNAFRDDAHLTAWAIHAPGLSGQAQEAFTFLWRDGLNSGEALQGRLGFRGHDAAAYSAALREVAARGWATETEGVFALTEAGRAVREAVEQKTDEIFFAPWAELNNVQLAQLLRRLLQLRQNLRVLVGDKIAAERKELWPQAQAAGGALAQVVIERTQAVREELGLNRPFAILALLTAYTQEKGIITSQQLQQRFPYVRPETLTGYLDNLVETGQLKQGQNGAAAAYYLTDNGRDAVQKHLDSFWGEAAALEPMAAADLSRLADLFERIVASIAGVTEPAKQAFAAMANLDAPEGAVPLVRIDHALDCLGGFRDDAHVATFNVSGHAWEAFSDIWQGAANTAEAVAERHQNRGYTTADYALALSTLVKRGWLSEAAGVYTMTEAGQTVRDEAERLTDRYFYGPWAVLDLNEVQEMRELLSRLETALKEVAEPVAA